MNVFQYEYSRKAPPEVAKRRYTDGEPILYAYNCALLERETDSGYIYTAVNLTTGGKEILSRRKNFLSTSEVEAMVTRIRKSRVAGASNLQADRPVKESITPQKAREILETVFTTIMPGKGFAVRNEQIDMANHILSIISRREVTLAEAETGTGKTHGYLIPAIIAKRGRLNSFHNMGLYPKMQVAEMSKMPIVIATSSIALQRAILTEYIPGLSDMLLDAKVIKEPLTAILRKGREHYICQRKLKTYLATISNKNEREAFQEVFLNSNVFDFADIDGETLGVRLTQQTKQRISVNGRCYDNCPNKESCQYLAFREQTQRSDIDIQVCNHNYLLADTLHRANGKQPLIPNYQLLIVDEAHKFLDAAQSMYGLEFSSESAEMFREKVTKIVFRRDGLLNPVVEDAKKLAGENKRLFKRLCENAKRDAEENESKRQTADIDTESARHLRNIHSITGRLLPYIDGEAFFCKAEELLAWVRRKYGADTSGIDLNRLLCVLAADDDIKRAQVSRIHNAILQLNEIQHRSQTEQKKKRKTGFSYNTERQVFKKVNSKIKKAIWEQTRILLRSDTPIGGNSERLIRLRWELTLLRDQAATLANHNELICWLETDREESRLCAIPKELDRLLFIDQWRKQIPTILTSGTLSAGGDFTHTKRTLGLDYLGPKLKETSKPSPFDYKRNAMLYISGSMPFPEQKSSDYIVAVADEVEKLIFASHGHAAVLFTSYKVMDKVWEKLKLRKLSFPFYRLDKGGVREIERFKASKGGVLFASGALWEGIDIPGDALSMLIIVKLPFQVPDPISEYEQTQYPNFRDYREKVIVPEMLIKLKQGFGRLIRTETDTGCVAILDSRANSKGNYRERVLNALPDCRVTSNISDINDFLRSVKPLEYWH